MNKAYIFLKKNSSNILSIIGSLGVVSTAILAVKATPKALELIKDYKENKFYYLANDELIDNEKISKLEIIKVAWKPYIPSIICGLSTITCIFDSNYINKKNQKALISAYGVLNNAYLNYREHIIDLYGKEADLNVKKEIMNSKELNNNDIETNDEEELFFDMQSMQYFTSTLENIKEVEFLLNKHISNNGYAYLNDLYDLLGINKVDYGYEIGWSTNLNDKLYSSEGVVLNTELVDIDNDMECNILTLSIEPSMDFIL